LLGSWKQEEGKQNFGRDTLSSDRDEREEGRGGSCSVHIHHVVECAGGVVLYLRENNMSSAWIAAHQSNLVVGNSETERDLRINVSGASMAFSGGASARQQLGACHSSLRLQPQMPAV
jgi:hypothetical protein